MKSILDPTFRYRTSVDTDIRATFARVRREQRKQARTPPASPARLAAVPSRQAGMR